MQIIKVDFNSEVKIFGSKEVRQRKQRQAIKEGNYNSDNAASQPSVGRDLTTDNIVREVQSLIDWDQIRAEVADWKKMGRFTTNFFKNIFIDYAITVVPFPPPLHSILPTPLPPTFPPP